MGKVGGLTGALEIEEDCARRPLERCGAEHPRSTEVTVI